MKRRFLLVVALIAAGTTGVFPIAPSVQASVKVDAPAKQDHVLARLKDSGTVLAVRTAGMTIAESVANLDASPGVDGAEPDYIYQAAAVPNDPDYAKQWYLQAAHLPEAWDLAKGSSTVTVAVIDSGVDLTHPDLQDRIWTNSGEISGNRIDDDHDGFVDDVHGWDFVDGDADPNPDIKTGGSLEGTEHGTIVAGVIGAAGGNGAGVTGVNWNVRLMPLRALDSQGSGTTLSVVAAIRYAVRNGAKVINLSFTGQGYSQIMADTLREAYRAGVIIVAAAGNEGDTARGGNLNVYPEYPVCYRGAQGEPIVLGVAALDARGVKSSFTNYGANCIGLSAPGENFYVTQVYRPGTADYARPYGAGWSGSSLAAPMVSGAAALLASMSPSISPTDARRYLTEHAANIASQNLGTASNLGAGELDVGAAVQALEQAILGGGVTTTQAQPPSTPVAFIVGPNRTSELVAASPSTGTARIALLKGDLSAFSGFDAYARRVTDAPSVAFVDLAGGGEPAIAIGAPKGELPYVRVFNNDGALVSQFLAFPATFRGGVNVARADIDANGRDEIAVAPASGGAPVVRMFNANGTLRGEFSVGNPKARTGIRITAIDTDVDGMDEIFTAPADALGHTIHVYDINGKERFAFDPFGRVAWRGGFEVAAGDLDGDGRAELVVSAGIGGPPSVKTFMADGHPLASWSAFTSGFRGGVNVAIARFGGSGHVVVGPMSGGNELRVYTPFGTLERTATPFGKAFYGAIRPASYGLSSPRK